MEPTNYELNISSIFYEYRGRILKNVSSLETDLLTSTLHELK
jgi:hypothetical protein